MSRENTFTEPCNSRLRDKFLNANVYATFENAKLKLDASLQDQYHHGPRGSLGNPAPIEFASQDLDTAPNLIEPWFQGVEIPNQPQASPRHFVRHLVGRSG